MALTLSQPGFTSLGNENVLMTTTRHGRLHIQKLLEGVATFTQVWVENSFKKPLPHPVLKPKQNTLTLPNPQSLL